LTGLGKKRGEEKREEFGFSRGPRNRRGTGKGRGKEETSSCRQREDRRRRQGERRGGQGKKRRILILDFSSSPVDSFAIMQRGEKEKRGEERRRGDRKEAKRRSERIREKFPPIWETSGTGLRKKAKKRRRKGSFSLLGQLELLPSPVAFAGFFGFLLLSYALLSLLPSLLSYELQRTILLSDAVLNCYTLSYFMLFYPTNCIVLAFRKETKKKKKYE